MKRIGVVGLGNMGKSMVRNLMKAGYEVHVYDIRPEAVEELAREGAVPSASVREVGQRSEAVFVMVLNYAQAKAVCLDDGGLFDSMQPDSVVIVTCTISANETRSIGAAAATRGIDMIDSPVSGGTPGAEAGTLVMMAACTDEVFQRCSAVLRAVGSNTYHVGTAIGMGQTVKAAIQLLVSIHVIAAAEAFALAQKAGVDPEMLAEIVGLSVGTSRMFELKAPKIMNRDFSNSGALDIQIKDLNICLAMGRELNVPLFLAAASRELYIMAEGMGYGREDLSAVVKLYEQASGVPVAKKQ